MTPHPADSVRRFGLHHSPRRANRVLLAAILVLSTSWACDKSLPTEPDRQAGGSTAVGPAASTSQVFFTSGLPTEMDAGDTVTFQVTVQTQQSTLPTQVALSTSLGNFGTSGSDPRSATESLTLAGSSNGVTTLRTGVITFYSGLTTGTASVNAVVGSQSTTRDVTITQPDALFLQAVSPNFGPPTGGTTVTISGVGFPAIASTDSDAPLPQVTFGGALGSVRRPTTSTEITVITPPSKNEVPSGSSLVVDVTVTVPESATRSAQTDTLAGSFTYTTGSDGDGGGSGVPPSIRSVDPTEGANAGGYSMTINGTNFETGTSNGAFNVEVRLGSGTGPNDFNGNSATILGVSSTAIRLTVPAATPDLQSQAVDLLVRNKTSGLAVVARRIFTYLGEGSVLDIDPRDAPYTGDLSDAGGRLTIALTAPPTASSLRVEFGDTFQATCPQTAGSAVCSFDGSNIVFTAIQSVFVSSCSPPSGAVMVVDSATGETVTGPTFSYTADTPRITGVSPSTLNEDGSSGSGTGPSAVRLTGSFSTIEDIGMTQVLVDGVAATVQSMDATSLTFTAPPFTGTFETTGCTTTSGESGTRPVAKAVDIQVTFLNTDCTTTASSILTYQPSNPDCTAAASIPVAGFSFVTCDPDSDPTCNPLTVDFTDVSAGNPTTLSWFFGDGAVATCAPAGCSVSHTYAAGGTYSVVLQASNSAGTDSFTQNVTVVAETPPVADFTFTVGPTNISPPGDPLTVQFTDTSTGDPTMLNWTFGDGNTASCAAAGCSVIHTYAGAATYVVILEVSNNAGSDSTSKNVTVTSR